MIKLRRDTILKVLREAGAPITIDELSKRTGIDIIQLRVDLFRLAEEGKVERRQRGNTSLWTLKVGSTAGQH